MDLPWGAASGAARTDERRRAAEKSVADHIAVDLEGQR